MVDPIFKPAERHFEVPYVGAIAAHYSGWKDNHKISLAITAKRLGRTTTTMHGVWNALEEYYRVELFERKNRRRTGRLTKMGEMVGAFALHFTATDYLLRNAGLVGDLGEFWAEAFMDDLRRYGEAGLHLVSLLNETEVRVDIDDDDDNYPLAEDEY